MKKTFVYAVANGRNIGIFSTWEECNEQVKGFSSAKYKKFDNEVDAREYIEQNKPVVRENIIENTCPHTTNAFVPEYYVYTDGSCVNNGRTNAVAGYGIYFGKDDGRNVSEPITGNKQTNSVAELTAILKTYGIIENDILSGKKIMIVSDSTYALGCVGYYGRKCYEQGWKKDIENKELVRETYELYMNYPNVQFMYIAAHTNNTDIHSIGNYNADKLANKAIGFGMK